MAKKAIGKVAVLILACLMAVGVRAADRSLSQDDVLLLLLGGATTEKMLALIEQRGIDFRMNPDLAKKFHDAGADDIVIEALQKASARVQPGTATTPPSPPATNQGQACDLSGSGGRACRPAGNSIRGPSRRPVPSCSYVLLS